MSRLQTSCPLSFVFPKVVLCQGHNNGSLCLFFGFVTRFYAQSIDRLNSGKLGDAGKLLLLADAGKV
jgi:hypothetical protein